MNASLPEARQAAFTRLRASANRGVANCAGAPSATERSYGPTITAATVPVFFISGPIIDKLKLNLGTGTGGGETPVTKALGYFVNLVGGVVGGSVPPNLNKSTMGSSADLVAIVFTENTKGKYVEDGLHRRSGLQGERSVSYTHLTLPTTPYV